MFDNYLKFFYFSINQFTLNYGYRFEAFKKEKVEKENRRRGGTEKRIYIQNITE